MRRLLKQAVSSIMIIFATIATLDAGEKPATPSATDKCPVCGMFGAKYPDFAAQVQFRDGTYAAFDGAKDMFRYFADPGRYSRGKKRSDITASFVTDYYTLAPIDGYRAFYVSGSDVYGPMGHELVQFRKGRCEGVPEGPQG